MEAAHHENDPTPKLEGEGPSDPSDDDSRPPHEHIWISLRKILSRLTNAIPVAWKRVPGPLQIIIESTTIFIILLIPILLWVGFKRGTAGQLFLTTFPPLPASLLSCSMQLLAHEELARGSFHHLTHHACLHSHLQSQLQTQSSTTVHVSTGTYRIRYYV